MLTHVTFTGWDRHTDLAELEEFLQACPQDSVEIAVLHSSSRIDDDRYPDAGKGAAILRTAKAAGQRAAVHLCGQAARSILESDIDGWPDVRNFAPRADRMLPFLFDRSAGHGSESRVWPEPPDGRLVGYAGGLGPHNVARYAGKLAETRPFARFWLDMESGIRERMDAHPGGPQIADNVPPPTRVSIARCAAVMKAVEKYMERPC